MEYTDERNRPAPGPSSVEPVRLVDRYGRRVEHPSFALPDSSTLIRLHRAMVIARRFDRAADELAGHGLLSSYPPSAGQEAAQVGGVLALSEGDWLFPTYRDAVAVASHGVDPLKALTPFRTDRRGGYDPHRYRCAPQCTPPATNASKAVEVTYSARRQGRNMAALALVGDGITGTGDARDAYGFAAVWNAPVVFLVRQARWAVDPMAGPMGSVGHDLKGHRVDGGDAAAVYSVVSRALAEARSGGGPALVEVITDTAAPLCHPSGEGRRPEHDPLLRSEALVRREGLLGDPGETERALADFEVRAERVATLLRDRLAGEEASSAPRRWVPAP
ncbi:thiamine pyrophosphate-dependent enzyme [Nocardiopsis lambiniae]|uniref:2-oxoisovalerate dehydrogenase subunit alpha n=1 Tax=Nocardiopsis lambiniae TaxID=3075539 RepID=A0ABU2M416_9ACTN|nr:thiamine pyrophosphate-dependent enzyme [Nocardiopsis sp. DSM 44743]MDT0327339.1 thiamine pyrophosphate-dependent enzyme [Nocardiopsis sp. DSM 44743]